MKRKMKSVIVALLGGAVMMTSCQKYDNGGKVSKAERNISGKDGQKTWTMALDNLYPTETEEFFPRGTFADIPAIGGLKVAYIPLYDMFIYDGASIGYNLDRDKKRGNKKAYEQNGLTMDVIALKDTKMAYNAVDNPYVKQTLTGWWDLSLNNDKIDMHLRAPGGDVEYEYLFGIIQLEKDIFEMQCDVFVPGFNVSTNGYQRINIKGTSFDIP
jgi:hypothetical protein